MKTIIQITAAVALSILQAFAQPFNQEIISENDVPLLLGKINSEVLSEKTYKDWYLKNFEDYNPKKELIQSIKSNLNEYTITAFFGSWCGDSKMELPRFYKILSETEFPLERLTVVAVSNKRDAYKQSPGGEEEGLNIHRVPTFIFYKNGKEVNRIVEHPVQTLEADIWKIIQDEEYIPNYNAVTIVNDALNDMGFQKFQKKAKKLLPKLKKEAKSLGELNTFSSVLFFSERKEEAIVVAKLNIKLFPEEAYPYENLANKLSQMDKKNDALSNYEKSLFINPKNERVQLAIEKIKENVDLVNR